MITRFLRLSSRQAAVPVATPRHVGCSKVRDYRIARAIYLTTILERREGQHTLRFLRRWHRSPNEIWRALAQLTELAPWLSRGLVDRPLCIIVDERPQFFEFAHGGDRVRIELRNTAHHSELLLTHTFAELGTAARNAVQWELALDCLDEWLAGRSPLPVHREKVQELFTKYAWEFGATASITAA